MPKAFFRIHYQRPGQSPGFVDVRATSAIDARRQFPGHLVSPWPVRSRILYVERTPHANPARKRASVFSKWIADEAEARAFTRAKAKTHWSVELRKVNKANKKHTHGFTVTWGEPKKTPTANPKRQPARKRTTTPHPRKPPSSQAAGKRAGRPRRRNPGELEAAAAMSEKFHGRPAHRVSEYDEPNDSPRTLAELGSLKSLTVDTPNAERIELTFGRGVKLAARSE